MIKILRVITRLNIGGPSRHAILLTEAFCQDGMTSRLISGTISPDEGDFHDDVRERGIPFHHIQEMSREISPGKDMVSFWKLFCLFMREKPQIVHTHMAKAGTLGRLAALCARVPIRIHTYHGHVFHDYFSRSKSYFFLMIERFLARVSHRLIAVSDHVREDLCYRYRIGPPENIQVIPLGLEIGPFLDAGKHRGTFRRELGLDNATRLVGIVGRLVPIKDHAFFLLVASEISKRRGDVRFIVVGDGALRGDLEREVRRLDLQERIIFLGWRKDLEHIYPDLDVVVLTSKNEGTPVSLIEAMACARPVVATRVGGIPDVVQDDVTGYLIPPGEKGLFCEKVEMLLGDPEKCRAFGEKGREWVQERYSKERLISDMKRLYEELIEKRFRKGMVKR